MPEVLTKYPDVVKKLLIDQGAKCGVGAKQHILTACPKNQFCSLKSGEFCVYGFNEVHQMTQVESPDFATLVNTVPTIYSPLNIVLLCAACLFGLIFGILLKGNK